MNSIKKKNQNLLVFCIHPSIKLETMSIKLGYIRCWYLKVEILLKNWSENNYINF